MRLNNLPPIGENYSAEAPSPANYSDHEPVMVEIQLPVTKPYVTYTLIGLTLLVFIFQLVTDYLFQIDLPLLLGAKHNESIQQGEIWRLITPVLVHGGFMHIAFNMYALYVIGPQLERHYGHLRFLILYMLGAFAGNILSFYLSPSASVGASTAIFGLIAAQIIFIWVNRKLFGERSRALLINLAFIVIVNLSLGLSPGIDNWGHLGGMIGGAAFAWFAGPLLRIRQDIQGYHLYDSRNLSQWQLAAVIEVVLLAALAAVNIVAR